MGRALQTLFAQKRLRGPTAPPEKLIESEKECVGSALDLSGDAGRHVGPVVDGKFFRFDGRRFRVRGVTYGTFEESGLGLFPEVEQIKRDFAAMAEHGVNTVRTYTVPDEQVLELAEEARLKLLIGVWWDDPRYLDPTDRSGWKNMTAKARAAVQWAAKTHSGHPAVLGFVLGNEIPGPIVRWHGRRRIEALLKSLYEAGKEVAPEALFSYANYPTTQYLDTGYFDFDCFNVFLEDEAAYRRYLAQLQVSAGDRPLVLTELGLDSGGGEDRQAETIDWQLRGAAELGLAGTCIFSWTDDWWVGGYKVEGWYFGLTRENREPKPALKAVGDHYRKRPSDYREKWPKASVVVCAYQAEDTIGECLRSLTELDYPDYEVLVVDDGSTDTTAEIARGFPVRLLSGGRLGLSGARNLGLEHAEGEIVAYIDADAQADPDWLTYLALVLEAPGAAGAGGPNPVPTDDPPIAQCVALSPGGPIHVLLDNERAEHVPGCNMAFWRERLLEIGCFDPLYRTAGDDVDVCWKLQERGYEIRFHPSAVVWHRRRNGILAFWRQQVGYGRAEALVQLNHPNRFNKPRQAIWRGVVYGPSSVLPKRVRVYSGRFGEAPFQRLYSEQNFFSPLPALVLILALCLPGLVNPYLLALPAASLAMLVAVYLRHGTKIARRAEFRPVWRSGALIGLFHLVPLVARMWGWLVARNLTVPEGRGISWPLRRVGHGIFLTEGVEEVGREAFLEGLRGRLMNMGLKLEPPSEWDEADITCYSALGWRAQIVSYESWGTFYLQFSQRLRLARLLVSALGAALLGLWSPLLAVTTAAGLFTLVLLEGWAFGRRVRWALTADNKGSHG